MPDYLRIFYYLNVSNELPVDSGFHVAYNLTTIALAKGVASECLLVV